MTPELLEALEVMYPRQPFEWWMVPFWASNILLLLMCLATTMSDWCMKWRERRQRLPKPVRAASKFLLGLGLLYWSPITGPVIFGIIHLWLFFTNPLAAITMGALNMFVWLTCLMTIVRGNHDLRGLVAP